MFVGHVGKDAMAAVGMVNTLMNFLQVSFSGLAFGATVVIARMYGEGDRNGAREALKQALMLCIAIGVTMTIICFFLREQIIGLFFGGATEAVTQNMNQYFSIVLFGILFMVFDTVVSGAVRGAGDTKTPMQVTIIENVVNVVLGICLIFGVNLFGKQIIPSFGLVGAGIAITVARVISGSLRVLLLFVVDGQDQSVHKRQISLKPQTDSKDFTCRLALHAGAGDYAGRLFGGADDVGFAWRHRDGGLCHGIEF